MAEDVNSLGGSISYV